MSYILKVRDENGNFVGIPAITGKAGFSPIASITKITGGHRLTITDVNGTKTVDVMDGEDGAQGPKGDDYVLTQDDKAEIANMVLDLIPNGDEVGY